MGPRASGRILAWAWGLVNEEQWPEADDLESWTSGVSFPAEELIKNADF